MAGKGSGELGDRPARRARLTAREGMEGEMGRDNLDLKRKGNKNCFLILRKGWTF